MRAVARPGIPGAFALAAVVLAAGCAHEPAFRAELPASLEADDGSIAVIGDLQLTSWFVRVARRRENNVAEQARLIADLRERIDDIGALVIVGDLVYTARSNRHWQHFDTLVAPFAERMPVLPAIGNHDYPCYLVQFCRTSVIAKGMRERFPWFVPGQPYAVERGDLLLVFLDSESRFEEQGEWLGDRLRRAAGRYRAALVFFHRPPFSNSIDRGAYGSVDVQEHIVPELQAAALPVVVFNGHIHGFEYIVRDGVHYLTTAGGGGPRGPMANERQYDRYRGPDCPQPGDGAVFRPYNYVLLSEAPDRLTVEIRGFCRGDAAVSVLDRVDIPL